MKSHLYGNTGNKVIIIIIIIIIMSGTLLSNLSGRRKETPSVPPLRPPLPIPIFFTLTKTGSFPSLFPDVLQCRSLIDYK